MEGVISVSEVLRYIEADRYLDKSEAARYLGVGLRTFEGWMGGLPKYRPGGKALFKKSELDQFMKQHREEPEGVNLDRLADEVVASVLEAKEPSIRRSPR